MYKVRDIISQLQEITDEVGDIEEQSYLLDDAYKLMNKALESLNIYTGKEQEDFMDEEDRLVEERGEQISDERRAEDVDYNPFTEDR